MHPITGALLLLLSLPAVGWSAQQDVLPGEIFKGDVLNIQAPNSSGWKLIQSSAGNWSFGRQGKDSRESYIASVFAFTLTETKTSDEFLAVIKQGIKQDTSADRFTIREDLFEYTDARRYPCVKYQSTAEDKQAKVSLFSRQRQILQIWSLNCRHPNRPSLGFAITFSHRGADTDPEFEKQGEDFVSGVTVPTPTGEAPSKENHDDP